MLKLMMTLVVWLLSLATMHMHLEHHYMLEAFQQLTPNVIEQTVRIGLIDDELRIGFDYETANTMIPDYFFKNMQRSSIPYTLLIDMFNDHIVCTQYCSEIQLTLEYDVFGTPSYLMRRYILDAQ
jgi:hypothetical protein